MELRMIEMVVGNNWSCKPCKAPVKPSSPTNRHPVFTGRMPLLMPNQQCQSIEGIYSTIRLLIIPIMIRSHEHYRAHGTRHAGDASRCTPSSKTSIAANGLRLAISILITTWPRLRSHLAIVQQCVQDWLDVFHCQWMLANTPPPYDDNNYDSLISQLPSVLLHYCLGGRKGIRPVNTLSVGMLMEWWWWSDWRIARLSNTSGWQHLYHLLLQ